jgi:hypothetical protein
MDYRNRDLHQGSHQHMDYLNSPHIQGRPIANNPVDLQYMHRDRKGIHQHLDTHLYTPQTHMCHLMGIPQRMDVDHNNPHM